MVTWNVARKHITGRSLKLITSVAKKKEYILDNKDTVPIIYDLFYDDERYKIIDTLVKEIHGIESKLREKV